MPKSIDINEGIVKKFVASIRPEDPEIRKQIDIGYVYIDKVFKLYTVRPSHDNSGQKIYEGFAKISFNKTKIEWNLYWMRASGHWELYQPFPTSTQLDKIIEIIKEDKHACFFG
ncbi:DUF3024 domain-containing protein [Psychroflexus planctonicus]|nr:DUF3024 domain-containing protein [Psychroflexus planctonicus]